MQLIVRFLTAGVPLCQAGAITLPRTLVGSVSVTTVLGSVIRFLENGIIGVCIAAFVIGGLMIILASGREEMIQKGRTIMIASVIALAVVLGAGTLLRLVFFGLSQ
ncbi:hypothetical protein COU77_01345 [Candidatus Peregrinibacteria bacterium CG10_big_fil_rev_8_21_14_0_10_49_16]|nr:MAG: hypothetical protein COW95_01275 [Candidatus Peregrinibacteria bacterium CG22_combo_CG10-13_8_21_14_all_49_11]PIR52255.1 MAG: hypothetical protein COU77_01345 [Candidatus Peregrinibacteria bacterium CG10_big_fil_rev_8_21_14_0_10_49_16]